MKIEIENLKAQMRGRDLNIHQKANAFIEFNKLLNYVEELEQLTTHAVEWQSEQLKDFAEFVNKNHPDYTYNGGAINALEDFLSLHAVNSANTNNEIEMTLNRSRFFFDCGHKLNKMENWKVGKIKMTVVTDSDEGLKESTGHAGEDAKKYYGGNLICESIWREKDAHLIAAAPKMLEALQNLENDAKQIPEHAWQMVKDAIDCALAKKEA